MELDRQKLDAWIERIPEPESDELDAYETWCEQNRYEPSDDHWEDFYEYVQDGREAAEEDEAERRADYQSYDYEYEADVSADRYERGMG